MRAAGLPPIITVVEPMTIESGGPTHVHMEPTVAAGRPPISTVGAPGGRIGPPTCGFGSVEHRARVHVTDASGRWHIAAHCRGTRPRRATLVGSSHDARGTRTQSGQRRTSPRALPLVRQRRDDSREGLRRHGLEGRLARGIGVTRAMQAMNASTSCSRSTGSGPVGEFRLVPDLRHVPGAARTRPRRGAVLTDHVEPDGDARGRLPADVPQAQEGRLRRARAELRAAFENEFSLARREETATTSPVDSGAVLLDHRDDDRAGVRRRAGRRRWRRSGSPSSSTTPSSATASRRSRPRTRPRVQAADEQVLVRETIRARRHREGAHRLAGAQAVAQERRQRHPRALLAVGGRAQPLLRRGLVSAARAAVPGGRARAPAGPVRADRAELQLLPPDHARARGRARTRAGASTTARRRVRVPSVVPRGGGGVDQRRAQGRATPPATRTWRSAG